MAQPQAYNRTTDFTERDGDDTNHAAINSELDAAALSINQIRHNLALIQKDDGTLANSIVGEDQLAPSAFAAVQASVNAATQEAKDAAQSALTSALTASQAASDAAAAIAAVQQAEAASLLNANSALSSATAAAASATAAAGSAAAASNSAAQADTSKTSAANSATAAANSATAAASAATTAVTQADNAATSAANAASSAAAASASAADSAGFAAAAASSASAAASSATAAAASASEAAASAASVNPANLVNTTGDQTIGGVKTFSSGVVGKVGGVNSTGSFSAESTGGSYVSMWTRRGAPFSVSAATSGSSYAPALAHQYAHNSGWDGVYSIGVVNFAAANPGAFVIHHLNLSGTQDYAWLFNGGNGDFVSPGNVTAFSDIRLKTDLTKISDALAKVNQLNGYTYTRKDTGERQTGVVAQEVQKVLPEAVIDNGETLAVAYGNMVGLLIEAIKELEARVKELEGR